jgi:uncharacterized protein YwgA
MTEREDIVFAVMAVARDRRITSRVRLQKSVYLLNVLGLKSGFAFEYHHYGPYSRELDNATADAIALELIQERIAHRVSDGASYSVFQAKSDATPESNAYGDLGSERVRELVNIFSDTNVTVLELAATIDFLWRVEKVEDWRSEIAKRKRAKVGGGRLEKAIELLKSLGQEPPGQSAARAA